MISPSSERVCGGGWLGALGFLAGYPFLLFAAAFLNIGRVWYMGVVGDTKGREGERFMYKRFWHDFNG